MSQRLLTLAATGLGFVIACLAAPNESIATPQRPQDSDTKQSDSETDQRLRWTIHGKVIDEQGNPISKAEVRMATGWGTLLGGGSTKTANDGSYTLRFGEGIWSEGPNLQVAWCFLSKRGFVYKSNSRDVDLSMAMARQPLEAKDLEIFRLQPKDLIVRDKPHKIDFVMARPAELLISVVDDKGNRIDDSGIQIDDSNQSSEVVGIDVDEAQKSQFELAMGVKTKRDWTLSVPISGRFRQLSGKLNFDQPGRYRIYTTWLRDQHAPTLTIDKVERIDGTDVTDAVLQPSPLARKPAAPSLQDAARQILRGVATANRLWLGPRNNLPDRWKNVRYQVDIEGNKSWTSLESVGQITPVHHSPIHVLIRNPDAAVIRSFTIDEEEIQIAYTLSEPMRMSAGNGLAGGGSFRGFFQTSVREGVLTIDADTMTPKSNLIDDKIEELYSEFVPVDDGSYLPLRVQVNGSSQCDWEFRVIEGGLWVADKISQFPTRISDVQKDEESLTVVARRKATANENSR